MKFLMTNKAKRSWRIMARETPNGLEPINEEPWTLDAKIKIPTDFPLRLKNFVFAATFYIEAGCRARGYSVAFYFVDVDTKHQYYIYDLELIKTIRLAQEPGSNFTINSNGITGLWTFKRHQRNYAIVPYTEGDVSFKDEDIEYQKRAAGL